MPAKIAAALATMLVLGSAAASLVDIRNGSAAPPREPSTLHPPSNAARSLVDTTRLPWQAPVGHRQPSAEHIHAAAQAPLFGEELQRLDRDLDRKLTICRGC